MINNEVETFYYIYRHIRLDKNVPFYIGIGTYNLKAKYNRSKSNKKRNIYWWNIVNKTSYKIEIVFKCNNRDLICQKEKEFISLYGRKEFGGTLTNLTDGGDFFSISKEAVERSVTTKRNNGIYEKIAKVNSEKLKGNKNGIGAKHPNQHQKLFIYDKNGKLCYQYNSIVECDTFRHNRIYDAVNKNKFYKGYKFFYNFLGDLITQEQLLQKSEISIAQKKGNVRKNNNITQNKPVDIYKYDTLEHIGQYVSIAEACRVLFSEETSHAICVAKRRRSHVKGYIFKYVSDMTPIEDFKKIRNNIKSEETKEKMQNSTKNKRIAAYEYNTGNFIGEYKSIEDACRKLGNNLIACKASLVAKGIRKQHKGFKFKFI